MRELFFERFSKNAAFFTKFFGACGLPPKSGPMNLLVSALKKQLRQAKRTKPE